MAITTSVARHYAIRMTVMGVLCVAFGLWGAYDLFVKIPREERQFEQFQLVSGEYQELLDLADAPGGLSEGQKARFEELQSQLDALGGEVPGQPSKFDRLVQVLFMSCLLMAPYFFWLVWRARRCVFALDDDGTLVLPGDRWAPADVAAIDMSRWMSKSMATVTHRDGRQVRLDDYVHHKTHLIVGAIASRLHPGEWDAQARRVR